MQFISKQKLQEATLISSYPNSQVQWMQDIDLDFSKYKCFKFEKKTFFFFLQPIKCLPTQWISTKTFRFSEKEIVLSLRGLYAKMVTLFSYNGWLENDAECDLHILFIKIRGKNIICIRRIAMCREADNGICKVKGMLIYQYAEL